MAMETIHAQIDDAGLEEIARHQAGVDYARQTTRAWAAPMIEAYGLQDAPEEGLGAELYRRMTAALSDIDHDTTEVIPRPHTYSRSADGGWEADKDHQAWVRLGWVTYDDFAQLKDARGIKPSYKLKPTPVGRQLIDGWRVARGEVDSATQQEINRQKYHVWLAGVKASRSSEVV